MRKITIIVEYDMDDPELDLHYTLTGVANSPLKEVTGMATSALVTVIKDLLGLVRTPADAANHPPSSGRVQ